MAIYIQSSFEINPNIRKSILDSSWVHGAMSYADTVEELPKDKNFVRQGNLGSVPDPNNPKKSILYQANTDDEGLIYWTQLKTGASTGGVQEIFYNNELDGMSPEEIENLPDDIIVVDDVDNNVGETNELIVKLMNEVNSLKKEIIKIKNTFNDMSAVDIEETTSNYGSYIGFNEGLESDDTTYPRVEVDWTDSSNGTIVHNGTSSKHPTVEVEWIDSESSIGWYEKWHKQQVEVYSSQKLQEEIYPYDILESEGNDVFENQFSDGADEKLTLRHFAPKYAKTKAKMQEFKSSLIPYELVLCLENNSLYFYDANKNKMVQLAGGSSTPSGDSSTDIPDCPENPTTDIYIDADGILHFNGEFIEDGDILSILDASVDSDGYLNLVSKIKEDVSVTPDGTLTINGIEVDDFGVLNIDAFVDEDGNLILNNKTENISEKIDEDGYLVLESPNIYVDEHGYLNIPEISI